MNTYRKNYSTKITFTQNGVIDTPSNRVNIGDSIISKITDALFHLAIVAGGLATVYVLIIK